MPNPSPIRRFAHSPILLLLLLATACTADTSTTAPATAPASAAPTDIKFETITIKLAHLPFTLEIADTQEKRERGLMYRKSMPADRGMVFIFDYADKYAFWMKDTELPIDLLFLDDKGKIILIAPLKPFDLTNVGPNSPASFAVELNLGAAKTLNLHVGDTFPLPDKLLKPAPHSVEK